MKSESEKNRLKIKRSMKLLVKDWREISEKKSRFAKSALKLGKDNAGHRAAGIASVFLYCAGRLEYEINVLTRK